MVKTNKNEAKALSSEAENYLRTSRASSSTRCHTYTPSIEELQSVSFSEYIRSTVLKQLSDGIAKITMPDGFWDKAGIDGDETGRTSACWQNGGKLGDLLIPNPIKQCISGIAGKYEFTMLEKKSMSIADFRELADTYRKKQLRQALDDDFSDKRLDELARQFWRRLSPTMEVPMYGADMEGTLFEGQDASGWNVDKLDSCLNLILLDSASKENHIPGVTNAYLYAGMWSSVFAAHTEDMNLLSINYLHAGAPKYWYAISAKDSHRFESLAASTFPEAYSQCKHFLRHKSNLLSPNILKSAGIRYTTQVQRSGDVMITFPGAYHFGFNTGFNVAESTNFAVPEWIDYGLRAGICLCHPHSVRVDASRIKEILKLYEADVSPSDSIGYSQWMKLERLKRKHFPSDYESCNDPLQAEVDQSIINLYKDGFILEVKGSDDSTTELRKAVSVENARKQLRVGTRVLCIMNCVVTENNLPTKTHRCFAGCVKEVKEGHLRIHFDGLEKSKDNWMPVTSHNIFLETKIGNGDKPVPLVNDVVSCSPTKKKQRLPEPF